MTTLENKTIKVLSTTSKTDILKLKNKEFNLGKITKTIGNCICFENKIINNNEYYVRFEYETISLYPVKNNLKTIHILQYE